MEFSRFINRLNLLLLVLAVCVGWLVWSPRNVDSYDAREDAPMSVPEAVAYHEMIESQLENGKEVVLKESDLNRFLGGAMKGEHSFIISPWVQVSGVYVDLKKDEFSLCVERDLIGLSHHVVIDYEIKSELVSEDVRRRTFQPTGGVLGRLLLPVKVIEKFSEWPRILGAESKGAWSKIVRKAGVIELKEGVVILKPQVHRVF